MGQVCEIKTGNKDTKDRVSDGTYPFFVRSNTVERINSYSFDGEAILTSGDGVGVGKNFHYINGKFDFHQRVYSLRNFKKEYSGKFVFNVFSDRFYKRVIKLSAKNSVDSVRMDMISKMKIYFPILEEQKKIASFFTLINLRIETQIKIIDNLESLIKGCSQKIFSRQLKFRDENKNKFTEWEYKNGNDLFKSISNKNHNSDLPILAITQDRGAIPRELIDYNIGVTSKSVSSYKIVEIGDFIISLRSFQGGIEYSSYKGICSPAYIVLKPIKNLNKQFYKYYLKTPSYITELNRKLEGIRDGKMISYKYFSEIKLPYPSLKEQSKIANFLSTLNNKLKKEQEILEQYQQQKKYLLQNLFI